MGYRDEMGGNIGMRWDTGMRWEGMTG